MSRWQIYLLKFPCLSLDVDFFITRRQSKYIWKKIFSNHSQACTRNNFTWFLITSVQKKIELFDKLNIDYYVVMFSIYIFLFTNNFQPFTIKFHKKMYSVKIIISKLIFQFTISRLIGVQKSFNFHFFNKKTALIRNGWRQWIFTYNMFFVVND